MTHPENLREGQRYRVSYTTSGRERREFVGVFLEPGGADGNFWTYWNVEGVGNYIPFRAREITVEEELP